MRKPDFPPWLATLALLSACAASPTAADWHDSPPSPAAPSGASPAPSRSPACEKPGPPSDRAHITRTASTAALRALIEIAERAPPPASVVECALAHVKRSGSRYEYEQLSAVPPDELWWIGLDNRQAFTVTRAALDHYLARLDQLGLARSQGESIEQGQLRYHASIRREPTFRHVFRDYEDVYVVQLYLRWHYYCGNVCGHLIERKRTVVLDADGRVLASDPWCSLETPIS